MRYHPNDCFLVANEPYRCEPNGYCPVPPCPDVQWVGPVPAGNIAPDVEYSRAASAFVIPAVPPDLVTRKRIAVRP